MVNHMVNLQCTFLRDKDNTFKIIIKVTNPSNFWCTLYDIIYIFSILRRQFCSFFMFYFNFFTECISHNMINFIYFASYFIFALYLLFKTLKYIY